jgi:hypothetical protein
MSRKRHSEPCIEKAVKYAESMGWVYVAAGKSAHAWGKIQCPNNDKQCRCGQFCQNSIWSTPKNPEAHAKKIRQWVEHCIYEKKGN